MTYGSGAPASISRLMYVRLSAWGLMGGSGDRSRCSRISLVFLTTGRRTLSRTLSLFRGLPLAGLLANTRTGPPALTALAGQQEVLGGRAGGTRVPFPSVRASVSPGGCEIAARTPPGFWVSSVATTPSTLVPASAHLCNPQRSPTGQAGLVLAHRRLAPAGRGVALGRRSG